VSARPFVVGLTGGIGSGKSAAADIFGELGAAIVDTDRIAHLLTAPGGAAMAADLRRFRCRCGGRRTAPSIARPCVRWLLKSPDARKRLEGHPAPDDPPGKRASVPGRQRAYVMLVVPAADRVRHLPGAGARLCVVDCPEEVQVARVMQRSRPG
jgi:dephospho-CoA kinase